MDPKGTEETGFAQSSPSVQLAALSSVRLTTYQNTTRDHNLSIVTTHHLRELAIGLFTCSVHFTYMVATNGEHCIFRCYLKLYFFG